MKEPSFAPTVPVRIGVTGGNGFVGRALVGALEQGGHEVRPMVRRAPPGPSNVFSVGDIGPDTRWADALKGLQCVIHCAAHVHRMGEPTGDSYQRVNALGTLRLAEAAALAGVQRLVFVSSIKVLGESTPPGIAFLHDSPPAPQDAYGASKWEAEKGLWEVAARTGLEVVVVRPPLVYGPGVGANLGQLLQWVARGIPLPLASVRNRRSLVALPNLVSLLTLCTQHPGAPGHTFLVSDGHDLSTPELVRMMAQSMGISARLVPFPVTWLSALGQLTRNGARIDRLTQNLQVNIRHTLVTLGWRPPFDVNACMLETVQPFRQP
jgi:nucleoside-diphosphate-sugar epimerase